MTAKPGLSIKLKDLSGLLKRLPKAGRIIDQEGAIAMTKSLGEIQSEVTGRTPVGATGALRNAWSSDIIGRPTAPPFFGKVVNTQPYSLVVEFGRKPGKFPPRQPIELWVRRVLGVPADKAQGVAFLVARKIAAVGTKGAFMARDGLKEATPRVNRLWRLAEKRIKDRLERG
jgi:hypothetical protein